MEAEPKNVSMINRRGFPRRQACRRLHELAPVQHLHRRGLLALHFLDKGPVPLGLLVELFVLRGVEGAEEIDDAGSSWD
jgi:hypothetical protein